MSTRRPIGKRLRRLLEREADGTQEAPASPPERPGKDDRQRRLGELRAEIERISALKGRRGSGVEPVEPEDWARGDEPWSEPPASLPGELVRTEHGEAWIRDKHYESGMIHGTALISNGLALTAGSASLLALDDSMSSFEMSGATFLDIETTGLSMGTGTVAFLVGLGWYEGNDFHVRQLFVDRLENEPAVLHALLECVRERPHLVTFNGKTFDVPVLRARLALNRLSARLERAGHLDLLHVARRLYKKRIGDCSLDSCERSVLGFNREGDIPGEMIPEIFVEYLRTGRPGQMHDVFHHNLLDVVSMAALAGRMADLLERREPHEDLDDLVSLARVRLRHGDDEDAEQIFTQASSSTSSEHRIESGLELAIMARRRGEHEVQRRLLETILEDDPDHAGAHLMLAKLYEHGLRLLDKALEHAHLAEEEEGYEASTHRIERLERRIEKRNALGIVQGPPPGDDPGREVRTRTAGRPPPGRRPRRG
ncbi:MAG: ribonuclease H-like domain-containing protein [Deltaproteobacteria bacterium]|nr:ribonuclease H-like domain-containing protein [Deltaproteobacteria bacterium]